MNTEKWSWEKSLLTSLHLGDTDSGASPLASKCLKRSSRLRWTRNFEGKRLDLGGAVASRGR